MSHAIAAGMRALIQRHPALTYFALTFAISCGGLLAVVGPRHIVGTSEEFERLFPIVLPFLVLGPVTASLVTTWLVAGRRGLRELRARLFAWRVDARWYAIALLAAPAYFLAIYVAFGAHWPELMPGIFVADRKLSYVASGMAVALVAGIVEELGWTGFAVPTLRRRYSATTTGVIVGVVWALWHVMPKIWGADANGMLPYLPLDMLSAFVGLTGFRILMVWVFERTQSLPIAIVMHVGLTGATLILQPLVSTSVGLPMLLAGLVVSAVPWVIALAIAAVRDRTQLRGWIRRHPAVTYFVMTFTISWGGILLIVGPNVLAPPEVFLSLRWVPPLILGPTLSGVLLTAIIGGRPGLHDYRLRLLHWRVPAYWYAIALLLAPLYNVLACVVLSIGSPEYAPGFLATDDTASYLISGTITSLSAGIFEELGWTGFATPTLRRRFGAFTTGLIIGVFWGLWHVLPKLVGARAFDAVEFIPIELTAAVIGLTGYRVLMVWVYDRTRSLLVGIVMHTGLTAALTLVQPQVTAGSLSVVAVVQAIIPWLIVAIVASRRHHLRSEREQPRWPPSAPARPAH